MFPIPQVLLVVQTKCKLNSLYVVFLQLTMMYLVMDSSHPSVFQEWKITNYIYILIQYLLMNPLYFLPMNFKYGHFYDMKSIKLYTYFYLFFFLGMCVFVYVCVYILIFLTAIVPQHTLILSLRIDSRNQNRTIL